MTDYTKIPGYEGMTWQSARYNYLHDMLERFKRMEDYRCTRPEHTADGCPTCPLRIRLHLLGAHSTCCNWEADAVPDEAVRILEDLLREENGLPRRSAPRNDKEENEMHRSVNLYWEPERPTEPPKEKTYYCPVCGEENPARYYRNEFSREIVGCNHCIEELDAAAWEADHAD